MKTSAFFPFSMTATTLGRWTSAVILLTTALTAAISAQAAVSLRSPAAVSLRGPGDGGGGKGAYCKNAREEVRFYSHDYLIAQNVIPQPQWYVTQNNPEAHLKAIIQLFQTKLEPYYPSTGSYLNRFVTERNFLWREQNFELRATNDAAQGKIPSNCNPLLQQITTHQNSVYITRADLMGQLRANGPMQESAHLVHEMFRMISDNSDEIAKWNRILHSAATFQMSSSELAVTLVNEGLLSKEAVVSGNFNIELAKAGNKKSFLIARAERMIQENKSLSIEIEHYRAALLSVANVCEYEKSKLNLINDLIQRGRTAKTLTRVISAQLLQSMVGWSDDQIASAESALSASSIDVMSMVLLSVRYPDAMKNGTLVTEPFSCR